MIDSHVHLLPRFVRDINGAIQRAKEAGLEGIVNSAIEHHDYDTAIELSSKHPGFIYTTLGIAPSMFEKFNTKKALERIRELEKEIVSVGEVGLDHHWIKEEPRRNKQKDVFHDVTKNPIKDHDGYKDITKEIQKFINTFQPKKRLEVIRVLKDFLTNEAIK